MIKTISPALLAILSTVIFAACTKIDGKPEVIRPVRTVTVASGDNNTLSFAGEVKPRYETRLAFRVSGQMLERRIEVGSIVAAGQVLATLDSRDLQLSETGARARLAQAASQALLAESDFKRYAELRSKNFISQAEFERRKAQFIQAREETAAAHASARQSMNQTTYGQLVAPHAGVVTAIEAESGQVVTAGQTIARLARMEEKEIAFSIPEHLLNAVKKAQSYEVSLWSKPEARYDGELREVSPVADAASRTYAARLTVAHADEDLTLGMTAGVRVVTKQVAILKIPMTALLQEQGRTAVWVVTGSPLAARRVPVKTGAVVGDAVQIIEGLSAGQMVVTVGVNMLAEGQKVRLLNGEQIAGVKL